jgi:hypothetical protein
MKKLTLVTILFVSYGFTFSQSIDTAKVILNAKLHIMMHDNFINDYSYIMRFIEFTPKYRFLESTGFDSKFVFFEIHAIPHSDTLLFVDSTNNKLRYSYRFFANLNHRFIFGYHIGGNKLYKLNGFYENDFLDLYNIIRNYIFIASYDLKSFSSKKRFLERFYIQDLDLECLYDYFIKKKKTE